MLSPAFAKTLDHAFSSGANIVATIHNSDERLDRYRKAPNALLLEVTVNNRDMLPDSLVAITKNMQAASQLSSAQRKTVNSLLSGYIMQAKLVQVQKLMTNAVYYVRDGRIEQKTASHWVVVGRHSQHDVLLKDGALVCDCDLFNGRRRYAGGAGECSHVQAVVILHAE